MFQSTFSFWRRLVGRGQGSVATQTEAQPGTQTDERRLWVRYPAELATTVSPANGIGTARISASVRDISLGGANLLVDTVFESGQLISMDLPLHGGADILSVLACIVRVSEESPGRWALGCVFSQELTEDDLEGLGARRVRHEPTDQRTWMRFPTNNVHARFQKVGDLKGEVYAARVVNISANGVGLHVKDRVDTGALLSVDFLVRDCVRRTILACVVRVTANEEGEWGLGCNFIRELSEEDLHALI